MVRPNTRSRNGSCIDISCLNRISWQPALWKKHVVCACKRAKSVRGSIPRLCNSTTANSCPFERQWVLPESKQSFALVWTLPQHARGGAGLGANHFMKGHITPACSLVKSQILFYEGRSPIQFWNRTDLKIGRNTVFHLANRVPTACVA